MPKRLTTDEFISKAIAKHGTVYNYTNTNYINGRIKVNIECTLHGTFSQQPSAHLNGQGCPKCSGRGNYEPTTYNKLVTTKHANKYTYNLPSKLSANTIINIYCPVHGKFEQRASSHLEGYGCKECAYDAKAKTYSEFCSRATSVHNNQYTYMKAVFDPRNPDVTAICASHGVFVQNKSNHLQGHGCPSCYTPGFDKTKPGTLYYLRVITNHETLWKIGITNRTIEERFTAKDLKSIEVLYQYTFEKGIDASDLEKLILTTYHDYRYTGSKILRDGNTELFTKDIFNNILNNDHEEVSKLSSNQTRLVTA